MKNGLFAILIVLNCWASGQNLVSNGSFLELDTCSNIGFTRIYYVHDWESTFYNPTWTDPNGSSDFYSNCMTDPESQIPSNVNGYQNVRLYDNYAGIIQYLFPTHSTFGDYKEGIQNRLKDTLRAGEEYCFQVYISLADDWSSTAIRRWELLLTEEPYKLSYFSHDTTGNTPPDVQITSPTFWDDKENWIKVAGSFVAEGGERYLSMGNFSSNFTFDTLNLMDGTQPVLGLTYYYIDDVSLFPCSTPIYNADAGENHIGCKGDSVTFSTPYRNDEYTYFWIDEFSDTLSTSTTLSVEVDDGAEYYLAQWDFKYDLTWDTVRVIPDYCPELELPNVFTPNNDGNNDFWKPIAEDIDQIEVLIYSRWGRQVFSYTGNYDSFTGWSPNEAPEGTYYALVKATDPNGRVLDQKGTVTLLR